MINSSLRKVRNISHGVWSERLTCLEAHLHKKRNTYEVKKHKRSHTAVFSEGWGVTLGEKHYSDLPHSLQRYVTPALPPTSPLQLSMEGTPTQSHERIHIITVLESTWHTKHHTHPFSLWGVLPLPRSVLHLSNQISDLSSEVLRRGAGQ